MNINQLEKELNKAIDDFANTVKSNYKTFEGEFCTKDDFEELGRQTFYALNDMKKSLLKFLKDL